MLDAFEVKLVAKERIERMAAEAILPDGRYHFWFNGHTMELCADILYKNPPRGSTIRFKTRTLNTTSVRCAKVIAQMKKQIIDKRLVEQAMSEMAAHQAVEERRAHVRRTVRAHWANQMRHRAANNRTIPGDLTREEFQAESAIIADRIG